MTARRSDGESPKIRQWFGNCLREGSAREQKWLRVYLQSQSVATRAKIRPHLLRSDNMARMERRAGADAMDYALFRWTIRPFPKGLCPFPNEYALFRWRAPFSHELRPYPKGIIRPFPKLYDQHSRDGHAGKDDRATSPTSTPAHRFGLTPFSNGLRPHPKGFRPFPMDHVLSRPYPGPRIPKGTAYTTRGFIDRVHKPRKP